MGMTVVEAYKERGIFGKLKASVLSSIMQNALCREVGTNRVMGFRLKVIQGSFCKKKGTGLYRIIYFLFLYLTSSLANQSVQ